MGRHVSSLDPLDEALSTKTPRMLAEQSEPVMRGLGVSSTVFLDNSQLHLRPSQATELKKGGMNIASGTSLAG